MALCLMWAMSINAQVGDAARRVHEALQAFVSSGEYNVSKGRVVTNDTISGGKATAYDFSQVFGVEGTNDASILLIPMVWSQENMPSATSRTSAC